MATAALAGLLGLADSVPAAPVPLTNPSFQADVVADGGLYTAAAGWTAANYGTSVGFGTWNPNGYFTGDQSGDGTPLGGDGCNVFTIYGATLNSGGRVHQATTTALTAGTTYTLTVAVGKRLNGDAVSWGIDLTTTSQDLGSTGEGAQYVARLTGTLSDLTSGRFVDKTVSFTPSAGHTNVGQNLRVHLWTKGTGVSGQTSVGFDNVRLDASATNDTAPPTIATLSPANGATGAAVGGNLLVTFSENVQKGTGTITLKKSADNSLVETFDVVSSTRLTVNSATVTIDPTGNLSALTGYYVQIDSGAIKDLAGNSFAGIADDTAWAFTTGATPASWTPSQLPNLALWLDGSDTSTLFLDTAGTQPITDNGAVARWNDKSANGRNFTQATSANRPIYGASSINGLGAATFNGSANFMSAGDTLDLRTNSLGMMAVVKYNTGNTSGIIIGKSRYAVGSGRYFMGRFLTGFVFGTGTQYQYVGESDFASAISAADSSTAPRLLGFDLNRQALGYIKNWIDGAAVQTSTFAGNATDYNSTDELWIGAYQGTAGTTPPTANSTLNGVIAEMVVIQSVLSDVDRQTLEGYLAWKWGTQANLPADHPYKGAPPNTAPPAIATLCPASGATGVAGYAHLTATFDENIRKGTGNITIRKSADDSVVETFDVATSPRITVSGATLTIDPTHVLAGLSGHYVLMDPGAVQDIFGNPFAGVGDSTTWDFTTGAPDTTPPALTTLNSPPNGATGVAGDAPLVLTFNEILRKGTGSIVIRRSDDGSVVDTIDVTSGNVTMNGAQVTITPNVLLPVTPGLYVEIGVGAFEDLSGNPFAGFSGAGTWNFSTQVRLAIAANEPQSRFRLSWESWPGQVYNLCGSPDLNEWSRMLTGIPASPSVNALDVNPAATQYFYQIESVPPVLGNASFEAPPTTDGSLSSNAPQGWSEFDPAGVGSVGSWNPPASALATIPDGANVACLHHAGSIPLQSYGLSRLLGATFAVGTDYQVTVEVGRPSGYAWPGYRVELWAGATRLAEDDNTLHPAAGGFLTSTVTYLHDAADASLTGQTLMIRLLSRGEDPDGNGPAAVFRVAFDQITFRADAAATGVVGSVQLVLPSNPGALVTNLAAVFERQIAQRCDATVVMGSEAAFVVELATAADAGAEGFRIENRPGGGIRIVGGGERGLVAGVGKFLRTSRYDQGGFTPGTWRGASVPLKANRGIYFATHFHNYYHEAPVEEIARYVEDLALWGLNELVVWYDLHHFSDADAADAVAFRARLHAVMTAAKRIGMDVSLLVIGNEAYSNSPTAMRSVGGGRGGYYPCDICPHKPGGMDYILGVLGHEFDWAADLAPRSVWIWPFDPGGCGTADCAPWATNGFMYCVEQVGALARQKMPGTKVVLSTWLMDGTETTLVANQLAARPTLADGLVIEGSVGAAAAGLGIPIVGFPEISMYNTFPWGGFGATPLTARAQGQWNAAKAGVSGGFPYSEGIFEDLTKIAYSQFYWSDQAATQTVREYIAFEFSPDVVDQIAGVVQTLEQNHHMRWWPGELEGVPLEMNWFPSYGAQPQADPGAEQAYATMQEIATRLTPKSRSSWRWRQLYLRALLDSELKTNGGSPNARCNRAFAELIDIYHAQNASGTVRPPLPSH